MNITKREFPDKIKNINKKIDHTLLRADASQEDIKLLCGEALKYGFYSVCVNSCHIQYALTLLTGSDVQVCTVAGFPLGASDATSKVGEVMNACELGATEVDMVMNIGAFLEGRDDFVRDEIRRAAEIIYEYDGILKIIIETCLLNDEEIVRACKLARQGNADFVKTSTGFSTGGATPHDVALMRRTVGHDMGVKASGGIKTPADAEALLAAGADRLGCSSSAAIMEQILKK